MSTDVCVAFTLPVVLWHKRVHRVADFARARPNVMSMGRVACQSTQVIWKPLV